MSCGDRRPYCPCAGCDLECLDAQACHLQPGDMRFIKDAKDGSGRLFIMQPEEIREVVQWRQMKNLDRFGKPKEQP